MSLKSLSSIKLGYFFSKRLAMSKSFGMNRLLFSSSLDVQIVLRIPNILLILFWNYRVGLDTDLPSILGNFWIIWTIRRLKVTHCRSCKNVSVKNKWSSIMSEYKRRVILYAFENHLDLQSKSRLSSVANVPSTKF